MRILALVALLAASTSWAQEPASNPQPPVPAQAPAAPEKQMITIPAGTRIPLQLASPISAKARPGSVVRAVTGFPVTVGTQLAIPVGTYVEGVMDKVVKGGRSGPNLQMHFTRLLYPSGYGVSIDGANTQAKALRPQSTPPELTAFAGESGPRFALAAGSSPELPTLQAPPSHMGAVVAAGVGAIVAGAVSVILVARHNGRGNGVLFNTGWQFEMVLASPLSVDAERVAETGPPSAQ